MVGGTVRIGVGGFVLHETLFHASHISYKYCMGFQLEIARLLVLFFPFLVFSYERTNFFATSHRSFDGVYNLSKGRKIPKRSSGGDKKTLLDSFLIKLPVEI